MSLDQKLSECPPFFIYSGVTRYIESENRYLMLALTDKFRYKRSVTLDSFNNSSTIQYNCQCEDVGV